ncbi:MULTISPECIES: hypothetical protein [Methylobacterium]|jgi:hypothetical protein|uniref:Uncharacterized protein n=2 Tax=Methylobacterium TaxID=407 RepID=A0A0C6FL47_9HYPH|nr:MULTISPECIES: hypothetical protein [Methylobacterium]MBZ6413414.1 hypothetical protein [Methylobacterium sp.]MBK3397901.1 hypothetical protein [Methylobacterium ajmalii]MBK3408791.1 hypothetical protein [Methylobacterium ajmalii]MBK3423186.1 hypothetical protein [Methylobacterium ajmalii]SFE83795.1 hypothetical protein SAMN04487844_106185 [Methylobacterium sp. yr596]
MLTRLLTVLVLLGLSCAAGVHAQPMTRNVLKGTCDKLVVAGKDVTPTCGDGLANLVQGRRTSFDFTSSDGTTISFSGTGMPQDRQEEVGVDALQPVSAVILTVKGSDGGITRDTLMTVGSCRFPASPPGRSIVACSADTQRGRFEGTFTTVSDGAAKDAGPKDAAPKDAAPKDTGAKEPAAK